MLTHPTGFSYSFVFNGAVIEELSSSGGVGATGIFSSKRKGFKNTKDRSQRRVVEIAEKVSSKVQGAGAKFQAIKMEDDDEDEDEFEDNIND